MLPQFWLTCPKSFPLNNICTNISVSLISGGTIWPRDSPDSAAGVRQGQHQDGQKQAGRHSQPPTFPAEPRATVHKQRPMWVRRLFTRLSLSLSYLYILSVCIATSSGCTGLDSCFLLGYFFCNRGAFLCCCCNCAWKRDCWVCCRSLSLNAVLFAPKLNIYVFVPLWNVNFVRACNAACRCDVLTDDVRLLIH